MKSNNMKNVIDFILMLSNTNIPKNKPCDSVKHRRPNAQYSDKLFNDVKTIQNIMRYKNILNNPVFVNIFIALIRGYVQKTNTLVKLNVQNIKLHDLINGLFYIYVYILLPVLYREKIYNIISGSGLSSNYKSFQFPDCVPVVNKYFEEHKSSTLKGLSFWRNVFIRLDVTQLKQSLLSLLKNLRKLRTSRHPNYIYIKLSLKGLNAKKTLNDNVSYYKFLQNNNATILNKTRYSVVDKTFTTLLASTPAIAVNWFLEDTYKTLNIKERAFKNNNILFIPNIFNENLHKIEPNSKSVSQHFAKYAFLLLIYVAQFIYNTTFYTSLKEFQSFYSTLVKENILTNGNIVEDIESFFLKIFGINASTSQTSAKHLINFDMVFLYVKLAFSVLKPLNRNNGMHNTTKCLCSFFHNFKMDKNAKLTHVDKLVSLVKHIVEHFGMFSVSYDVLLPNNKHDLNQIIKLNENNDEFVSILSVYLTVINILRLIKNNKVTFESGLLTTNNANKNVHLISMYDNDVIVKALKEFIIIQNMSMSDVLKRSYRKKLETVILTKALNIPNKLIPPLRLVKGIARQIPKIVRPIAKVTKHIFH